MIFKKGKNGEQKEININTFKKDKKVKGDSKVSKMKFHKNLSHILKSKVETIFKTPRLTVERRI